MEKFKSVLVVETQGDQTIPVVTATNINFSFQNGAAMSGSLSSALDEGNFDISADLEMVLKNGQTVTSKMPTISKRVSEMETVIANMKGASPEKTKLQAELTIWKTMIEGIQNAIGEAMKSNYELQNPVQ